MNKMAKAAKLITKRRKFFEIDVPILETKFELIGNSIKELENRTLKLDLTRQLRGKGVEAKFKIIIKDDKAIAIPQKIKLMSYFIKRMIRKKIIYVEDSFTTPSQESMIEVKPFLITRKKVSRVIRKTLRNKTKNWLEDYVSQKTDEEIFNEILSNRLQKPLSLTLKKTYPLSLCEIRILEVKRKLNSDEIPKIKKEKEKEEKKEKEETFIDQLKEIEDEKIKKAEEEIKKTQEKAAKKEKKEEREEEKATEDEEETKDKKEEYEDKEKKKEEPKEKPKKEKVKKETKTKKENK